MTTGSNFWVIGGEFGSMNFHKLVEGSAQVKGPFKSRKEAEDCWREVSEENRHKAGVRFSIDDFGTGHSSLSQISVLPVDELKIDRSFIAQAGSSAVTIITSTIELGHSMGLKVVAEGVEDPAAWNLLRFEVSEEASAGGDAVRYSCTPALGAYSAVVAANGDVLVPEGRIRAAVALAASRAPGKSSARCRR